LQYIAGHRSTSWCTYITSWWSSTQQRAQSPGCGAGCCPCLRPLADHMGKGCLNCLYLELCKGGCKNCILANLAKAVSYELRRKPGGCDIISKEHMEAAMLRCIADVKENCTSPPEPPMPPPAGAPSPSDASSSGSSKIA
jgi:hypothetical protein